MTDETNETQNAEQDQKDQETVAAGENKIVEESANTETAPNASTNTEEPVSENTTDPEAVPSPTLTAPDLLDQVIAAGIKQYDGYAEHAEKVDSLRGIDRNEKNNTSAEDRDSLAKVVQEQYSIDMPTSEVA